VRTNEETEDPRVSLSIRPLHPAFGAEVANISIADDPSVAWELRQLVSTYGVLVIRDQHLSDDDLEALGPHLGEPVVFNSRATVGRPGSAVFHISNIDAQGAIVPATDRRLAQSLGNMLWHTDGTYTRPRQEISALSARTVPASGGETEFCDTRVAFEQLSEAERREVSSLTATHSIIYSRGLVGFSDWSDAERASLAPVERPLVRRHAETGRMALVLAMHMCEIGGYSKEAGLAFIERLIAAATREDLVYTHHWRVGDLVMWDNRCTMHRGRPYDMAHEVRDMRSLRTIDRSDLEAVTPAR
jgi:alpha-ketoglutarate-dependent 2,4-dichlorophenoxyacetate dioxygenase